MSRAQRILGQARREGWLCAVCATVTVAAGVWAWAAWLYGQAGGCALLALVSMAALRLALWHWCERRRLRGKVWPDEVRWNPPPVVKASVPAKPQVDAVLWIGLAVALGVPAALSILILIFRA